MEIREIRHFHLFCGLGGGVKGFHSQGASKLLRSSTCLTMSGGLCHA